MMGFLEQRALLLIFETMMLFMPQMSKLNGSSSSSSSPSSMSSSYSSLFVVSSFSAIVVAFDVAVLSNALESFTTKGGGKESFDLYMCMSFPFSQELAEGNLDELLYHEVVGYRAVVRANCTEINPQFFTDYNQILYLMIPNNTTVVGKTLVQISQFYHMIKRTFYSSRVGKLSWMPLFLVVWPELEDYCRNDTTTEKLIRASFHQRHNNKAEELEEAENKGVFVLSQTFSVNSDVYFYFGRECEGKRDNVWEVYSLHPPNGEILVQKLTPDGRPYESMYEGILGRVRRRRNLREATIKAIASKDPSSFLEGPAPGLFNPLAIVNGTPHVVFNELSQGLNFTVDIIIGDWVRKHPNGTLKGTTANLFRMGLADVTISLTSLLPYRKVELSFLQPTYSDSINGFFVQPAASSFRDIVIAPFSFGLWLSLLITYLIIVASVYFFGWAYRKMYADIYAELPDDDYTFRNELLLWAVGAVTQQGWYICPHTNCTRFAFMLGYFLGLVCYGAFSAAVVSILAVELIPIKTRSDLLNSSLQFYADDASSTMAYIVDFLRANTKITFGDRVNIEQGVKMLRSKKHPSCYLAFPQYFYLSAAAINISESWICDHLSVIPVTTSGTPSSMVIPRNSQYAELFNFMILNMIGRGLNSRYSQLYREITTFKCSKDSQQVFHPLGYSDMFTAFLIIFGGGTTAIFLILLENLLVILKKWGRKMRTTTDTVNRLENGIVIKYGNWVH